MQQLDGLTLATNNGGTPGPPALELAGVREALATSFPPVASGQRLRLLAAAADRRATRANGAMPVLSRTSLPIEEN
eukprot:10313332-Lingulodinium_polyedra.AAC.1